MASSFAVPNSSQTTQQHGRLYRILVNPWFLLAMITILILFLATQLLVPCDEAMWAYCSWLWSAHGVPPYVGSIENKSPGIFLLYRLSYALFGLSYMPPRLLDVAAVLGTMLLLYFLGKRYQGRFTGAMTAVIFGLMMTSERTDGSATAYTEVFLVFFTTLAFYLLTLMRWDKPTQPPWRTLLWVGATLGAAIGFKQIAVLDAVAMIPVYLCLARKAKASWRWILLGVFPVAGGVLLVTFLSFLPLWLSGATLWDYWHGVWWSLLNQSGYLCLAWRVDALTRQWCNLQFAILFTLAFYGFCRRDRLRQAGIPIGCILFWLGMVFFGASSSAVFRHQAKPLMAPLALAAGISLGDIVRLMAGRMPKLWGCVYAVIVVILFPYDDVEMAWATNFPDKTTLAYWIGPDVGRRLNDQHRKIAEYIQSHSTPSDSVYIWDFLGPNIHVLAQRRSPTPYFSIFLRYSPDFRRSLESSFAASPPKFIVINQIERYSDEWFPPPPQWVCEYVCRHCVLARQFSTIKIFQVVGSGGAAMRKAERKSAGAKLCKIPEAL